MSALPTEWNSGKASGFSGDVVSMVFAARAPVQHHFLDGALGEHGAPPSAVSYDVHRMCRAAELVTFLPLGL